MATPAPDAATTNEDNTVANESVTPLSPRPLNGSVMGSLPSSVMVQIHATRSSRSRMKSPMNKLKTMNAPFSASVTGPMQTRPSIHEVQLRSRSIASSLNDDMSQGRKHMKPKTLQEITNYNINNMNNISLQSTMTMSPNNMTLNRSKSKRSNKRSKSRPRKTQTGATMGYTMPTSRRLAMNAGDGRLAANASGLAMGSFSTRYAASHRNSSISTLVGGNMSLKPGGIIEQVQQLIKKNIIKTKKATQRPTNKLQARALTHLKRGGVHVSTSVGAIQFGMPPETIKDVLLAGLSKPTIYVVPKERFNLGLGMSCAEVEFPMFFSFFVNREVATFITDKSCEPLLDKIIREATVGPEPQFLFPVKEYGFNDKSGIPDLEKEIEHFKVNAQVVKYRFFDSKGLVDLTTEDGKQVLIYDNKMDFTFEVFDYTRFKGSPYFDQCTQVLNSSGLFEVDTRSSVRHPARNVRIRPSVSRSRTAMTTMPTPVSLSSPRINAFHYIRTIKEKGWDKSDQDFYYIIPYVDAERIGNLHAMAVNAASLGPDEVDEMDKNPDPAFQYDDNDFKDLNHLSSMVSKAQALLAPSVLLREKDIANSANSFNIPKFGVTILGNSHGFDPKGSTTGFVIWINGQGIIVDPPPHSSYILKQYGITSKAISAIILTHCHADHDAGTFQKVILDQKVDLFTSATIYESFLRKYSAVSGLSTQFLNTLFHFRPVYLGEPNYWRGAVFNFFYSLHSIPCMGFRVDFGGKSMVYSADTFYEPKKIFELAEKGVLSVGRRDALLNFPFDCDLVLHEAGVPPIHTPIGSFLHLPKHQRDNIRLVHISGKEVERATQEGLQIALPGVENSMILIPGSQTEDRMVKWLQIISSMEIFNHFSVQKALELVYMAHYKKYSAHEWIQGQSEEGMTGSKNFMIIVSGSGSAIMQQSNIERNLSEGDYFGEFIFMTEYDENVNSSGSTVAPAPASVLNMTNSKRDAGAVMPMDFRQQDTMGSTEEEELEVGEVQAEPERDESTDPDLSANDRHNLAYETLIALTDMEVLELDFYAVKNLLLGDNILMKKMSLLVDARSRNYGWDAIQANSIIKNLPLEQKQDLQRIMKPFAIDKEETVKMVVGGSTVEWKKDKPIQMAILVAQGALVVDESRELNSEPTLLFPGLLLYEYHPDEVLNTQNDNDNKSNKPGVTHKYSFTLKAHEPSLVYAIETDAFKDYLERAPHLMLAIFKSVVVL